MPQLVLLSAANGQIWTDITVDYDALQNGQQYQQRDVTVHYNQGHVVVEVLSANGNGVSSPGRIINVRGVPENAATKLRVTGLPHSNFHTYLRYKDCDGTAIHKAIEESGRYPDIEFGIQDGITRATANVHNTNSHPWPQRDLIKVDFYLPSDTEPPEIVGNSTTLPAIVQRGSETREFSVTYSDNAGVDVASIGTADIQVSPGGPGITHLRNVSSNEGRTVVATYRISPPSGGWTRDNSKLYGFSVKSNEVTDTSDNGATGRQVASLRVGVQNAIPQIQRESHFVLGQDARLDIPVQEILNNLSDSDGDTIQFRNVSVQPPNGTVTIAGGNVLTYTPNDGFSGSDTFSVRVYDGHGGELDVPVRVTVELDVVAPEISLSLSQNLVTEWGSTGTYTLSATFRDNRGIDTNSLGDQNFVLKSPVAGASDIPVRLVRFIEVPPIQWSDPSIGTTAGGVFATYELDSPDTGWMEQHNGEWKIVTGSRPGRDDAGNEVRINASPVFTVAVTSPAPTAELTTPPDVQRGTTAAQFNVTYSVGDASNPIDITSIGDSDFLISNGQRTLVVKLVDANTNDADGSVFATYEVLPPENSFGFSWRENGVWTIAVVPEEVIDSDGTAVAAGTIGSFEIDLANLSPSAVADQHEFAIGGGPYQSNVSVLENDSDPDNQRSDLKAVPRGVIQDGEIVTEHGRVTLYEDGTYIFTPNDLLFIGTDEFEYAATDGNSDSTPVTVSLTITGVDVDLAVSNFDVINDYIDHGKAMVQFTVSNHGTGPSGRFEVDIVHSDDNLIGGPGVGQDDRVVETVVIDNIPAGGAVVIEREIQLDRLLLIERSLRDDPGTRGQAVSSMIDFIGTVVDPDDQIAESNASGTADAEANNSNQGQSIDMDDVGALPSDIDGDGVVAPLDSLAIISRIGETVSEETKHLDLDGDGIIAPLDALHSINQIGYVRNGELAADVPAAAKVVTDPGPSISFVEDFSDSKLPEVWSEFDGVAENGGSVSVEQTGDGFLQIRTESGSGRAGVEREVAPVTSDFELEVDLAADFGAESTFVGNKRVGVQILDENDNAYTVHLAKDRHGYPAGSHVMQVCGPFGCTNPREPGIAYTNNSELTLNLSRAGDQLTVTADGRQLFTGEFELGAIVKVRLSVSGGNNPTEYVGRFDRVELRVPGEVSKVAPDVGENNRGAAGGVSNVLDAKIDSLFSEPQMADSLLIPQAE